MQQSKNILKIVIEAAKKAGDFLVQSQSQLDKVEVIEKSANQLVSEIDINTEKIIVAHLQSVFPEAGFITEEDTISQEAKELKFIIDPLDGTTNYLHKLDLYSVSIAATFKDELIAGVVYVPSRNELFHAHKGGGAFLNEDQIYTSKSNQLKDSLLATGFPYYAFTEMDAYLKSLSFFMKETRGLRRMGSAAIDLAYTACGRFCGFFELNLSTWDVAAGILLVQEAGGTITDFKGHEGDISGKEILATNTGIYRELKQVLNKNFYI